MNILKRSLLSSVIGLATCLSAQAADLPTKAAAPIEYVRVCSAFGTGFFYIPGTDTCLRVSGRARFETGMVGSFYQRNSDIANYRGLMRLNIDARTQTDYGTLRAFTRLEVASRTGNYLTSISQQRIGNAFGATGQDQSGRVQQYVNTDKAFIQFAGITAGRASSFFDFYAHDFEMIGATLGSDIASTNLLAYTRKLGDSGFSATISMEDPSFRFAPVFSATASSTNVNTALSPIVNGIDPLTGLPSSGIFYDITQRNRTPDFVGALRLDQSWGSAQLSAAVHEIGVGQASGAAFGINGGRALATPVQRPSSEFGWAVQGGLKVNLPFLAVGDTFYLQGAYGEGALSYTGFMNYTAIYIQSANLTQGSPFAQYFNDAIVNPLTGRIERSTSFSVVASFLHYWSPEWRSAFFGSYGEVHFSRAARAALSVASPVPGSGAPPSFVTNPVGFALSPILRDNNQLVAGGSLIWSPVKDLDIGLEGLYTRVALNQGRTFDTSWTTVNAATGLPVAGSPVVTVNSQDTFQLRARVQRDF